MITKKKYSYFNSLDNQYSIGGSTLSGAAKGAASGTALGPWGAVVGGAIGGITGFIKGKKDQKQQNEEAMQKQLEVQKQFDSQMNISRLNSFNENINNIIDPNQAFYGGLYGSEGNSILNSTMVNKYNGGGTHEQNPNGGIPIGIGSNGKTNTVESEEVAIDLGNDGKYIFSNRLKFE